MRDLQCVRVPRLETPAQILLRQLLQRPVDASNAVKERFDGQLETQEQCRREQANLPRGAKEVDGLYGRYVCGRSEEGGPAMRGPYPPPDRVVVGICRSEPFNCRSEYSVERVLVPQTGEGRVHAIPLTLRNGLRIPIERDEQMALARCSTLEM